MSAQRAASALQQQRTVLHAHWARTPPRLQPKTSAQGVPQDDTETLQGGLLHVPPSAPLGVLVVQLATVAVAQGRVLQDGGAHSVRPVVSAVDLVMLGTFQSVSITVTS